MWGPLSTSQSSYHHTPYSKSGFVGRRLSLLSVALGCDNKFSQVLRSCIVLSDLAQKHTHTHTRYHESNHLFRKFDVWLQLHLDDLAVWVRAMPQSILIWSRVSEKLHFSRSHCHIFIWNKRCYSGPFSDLHHSALFLTHSLTVLMVLFPSFAFIFMIICFSQTFHNLILLPLFHDIHSP